jgi:hypothetical protein
MTSTSIDAVLDPTLAADKAYLTKAVAKALEAEGLTLGFRSAGEARRTRRRMYYVAQQLAEFDRQQVNRVEFKLVGRTIALLPKKMLSSVTTQEITHATR